MTAVQPVQLLADAFEVTIQMIRQTGSAVRSPASPWLARVFTRGQLLALSVNTVYQ